MTERDYIPELYTERDVVRTRRRHRLAGRVEGAAAAIGLAMLWNFLPWLTGVVLVLVVGYVMYRLVAKSRPAGDDA